MFDEIYQYIGAGPDGVAFFFNNLEDVAAYKIEKYFVWNRVAPIPAQPGVLMTDGISKVWWELYESPSPDPTDLTDPQDPLPDSKPSLSERVEELEQAFDALTEGLL